MLARVAAPAVLGFNRPKFRIRGRDFAGQVEEAGAEVTRFAAGDDVYGDLGDALVLSGGGPPGRAHLVGPMGLLIRAQLASRFVPHRIVQLATKLSRDNLAALSELAEAGRLRPVIDRTYPLSGVPAAIRYVEEEHPRARVVIAG